MAADHGPATVTAGKRAAPEAAARMHARMRNGSLAALIALVIQYALGVAENLYGPMPGARHPVGLFSGGALLAIHGTVGILMAIGSIQAAFEAVRSRNRLFAVTSLIAVLALILATVAGFVFTASGQDAASLTMALAAGIALICYAVNIWALAALARS